MLYIGMLSFSAVIYNVPICLFVGGIGNTGILKVLKGWRTESYVSLSFTHTLIGVCLLLMMSMYREVLVRFSGSHQIPTTSTDWATKERLI